MQAYPEALLSRRQDLSTFLPQVEILLRLSSTMLCGLFQRGIPMWAVVSYPELGSASSWLLQRWSKPKRPLSPPHGRSRESWGSQEGAGGDAHARTHTHPRPAGRQARARTRPAPRQRLAHSAGWVAVVAAAVGARALRVLGSRRVCGARPATLLLSRLSLRAAF